MIKRRQLPFLFIIAFFLACNDEPDPELFMQNFDMTEWQRTDNKTEPYIELHYMRIDKEFPLFAKHWETTNIDIPDFDCFYITNDISHPEIEIIESAENYFKFKRVIHRASHPAMAWIIRHTYTYSYRNGVMTEKIYDLDYEREFTYTWERSDVDLSSLEMCD